MRYQIGDDIPPFSFQYGDRELKELWSELQLVMDVFFKDVEIVPSLLHGDLWSGNAAETESGPGNLITVRYLNWMSSVSHAHLQTTPF